LTAAAESVLLNEVDTESQLLERNFMAGRTVLATLGGKGPSQRLQVSLSQGDDGRLLIDLREQHHAEGIGWFDQRRLELDPRQFQQLQAVLAMNSGTLSAAIQEEPAILPFPGPALKEAQRPAAGGDRG
jgi:hypothetical protein